MMIRNPSIKALLKKASMTLACLFLAFPTFAELDEITREKLTHAINGDHRSDEDKYRDQFRKPLETLEFLGLKSDMSVVEMWPGSGWYTKILAPVMQENGKFYAAVFDMNGPYGFQRRGNGTLLKTLGETPDLYRDTVITEFDLPYKLDIAPTESIDMVLTFRNVHNWVMDLFGSGDYAKLGFDAAYKALKPGGIFGVVDHKWDDPDTESPISENGYMSIERTVALAESAGFVLVDQSDLLANPKDTKDHPRGVWTLPPSYALGEENRDLYEGIGESDRFLLKFQKP